MAFKYRLKKRTQSMRELHDNLATYGYYEKVFEGLAISNFKWQNMPIEIDTRYMELKLYRDGHVCFAYDDIVQQYICLPCTLESLDIYGNPLRVKAYGLNGYQREFTNHKDCVVIYNNTLKTNSVDTSLFFASKLTDIDRTIDTNIFVQKTPAVIRTDENKLLSVNQIIAKYENNEDILKLESGSNGFTNDTFGVFNFNAPFIADKLYELKVKVYNEALTYLGISNVSYQKKERLISDEVTRQQGGIVANRNTRLTPRETAAKEINNLFGLDISVEYDEVIDNTSNSLLNGSKTNEVIENE